MRLTRHTDSAPRVLTERSDVITWWVCSTSSLILSHSAFPVHRGVVVPCRDPCGSAVLWCASQISLGPTPAPRFTVLLLSHTDKLFTPHQRRLLPAERHLAGFTSLLSIFPSLSVFAFLSSSCFQPLLTVNCIPSLVQNPRIFLHCVKNKPSFYVSCISLLCPFFLFHLYLFSSGSNKTRKP